MQAGQAHAQRYKSSLDGVLTILKEEGVEGLYKGVGSKLAQSVLDEGKADVVLVGRMFQKHPGFVWKLADDLGVELHHSSQIGWGFQGRAKKADKPKEKD